MGSFGQDCKTAIRGGSCLMEGVRRTLFNGETRSSGVCTDVTAVV